MAKTVIPQDFKVTDQIRKYCADKWTLPYLADVFLTDFIECFTENERKHANWETTYKVYLRRASPSGPFYGNGQLWERRCVEARRYKSLGKSNTLSHTHPGRGFGQGERKTCDRRSTWVASETGKQTMRHIRDILGK